MRFWLAVALLLLAVPVEAAITVTSLTNGNSASSPATTASISPNNGDILVVFFRTENSSSSPTVSGLGATWTNVGAPSSGCVLTTQCLSAWHTISNGTAGTLTLSLGGSPNLLVWDVLAVRGARTTHVCGSGNCGASPTDGLEEVLFNSIGNAGTTTVSMGPFTRKPNDVIVGAWASGSGSTLTFTQDPDAGWVIGNNQATPGNILATQWVINGTDATADGTFTVPSGLASYRSIAIQYIASGPLYMSGMEMGTPRVNSGAEDVFALGGTIDQVTVHGGAWALRQVLSQTTLINTLNTPTLACRFYFYPEQAGAGTPSPSFTGAMRYRDASANILMSALLNNDVPNHMQISNIGAGFSTVTGTTPIMGNTWYRIDVIYDSAAGGVGQIYVNGVLDVNTTHTGTQGNVNNILVNGAATPENHIFDDIYCQDGTAEPPDGRIIVRQGVAGSPTDIAWTLSGCSGAIETCWSNTGFTTASSANSSSTTSAIAQTMVVHPFSTVAAGYGSDVIHNADPINAVQIAAVAKTSATSSGGNAGNFRKYVNGVGPTDETVTITAVDSGYKSAFFTDTLANLDLYQIGWNKSASTAARTQTVEDMWLMVDFLPPATPSARVKHKVTQ